MGFWDKLGSFCEAYSEVYNEYYGEKTVEELCNAINSKSTFALNNEIELTSRVREMGNRELIEYYDEYSEYAVQDAANIFYDELKKRGYF